MRVSMLIFAVVGLVGGCGHVTIQPESQRPDGTAKAFAKVDANPSYTGRRNYYGLGLIGEHRVNVKEICASQKVLQMQSLRSFTDASYALLTLGIYTPVTVKVWCKS